MYACMSWFSYWQENTSRVSKPRNDLSGEKRSLLRGCFCRCLHSLKWVVFLLILPAILNHASLYKEAEYLKPQGEERWGARGNEGGWGGGSSSKEDRRKRREGDWKEGEERGGRRERKMRRMKKRVRKRNKGKRRKEVRRKRRRKRREGEEIKNR